MVLEMLIKAHKAEEHPQRMFFLGLMYGLFSIIISLIIFRGSADMVSVFFCTLLLVPLFYDTLLAEEYKELHTQSERRLLMEHAQAIKYLVWIFVGITCAYALAYVSLPADLHNDAFATQIGTITEFNDAIQNDVSGATISGEVLTSIILNNAKVLLITLLLGFISGAGVLLVIVWNASVIGTALGTYILNQYTMIAEHGILLAPLLGFLRYALHGIPEIVAYFIAAMAGGLLSLAAVHHHKEHVEAKSLMKDVGILLAVSIGILIMAALIEVFVTPILTN